MAALTSSAVHVAGFSVAALTSSVVHVAGFGVTVALTSSAVHIAGFDVTAALTNSRITATLHILVMNFDYRVLAVIAITTHSDYLL